MDNQTRWTFDKINRILSKNYTGDEIEVWDDLWFWGFITQKGSDSNRSFEWNEDKYWSLLHTPKDKQSINQATTCKKSGKHNRKVKIQVQLLLLLQN